MCVNLGLQRLTFRKLLHLHGFYHPAMFFFYLLACLSDGLYHLIVLLGKLPDLIGSFDAKLFSRITVLDPGNRTADNLHRLENPVCNQEQ